jgi:hypothetical protein
VQAEGLRAAGALLERMLRSEPEGGGARPRREPADYTALVDTWTDVLQRTVAGLAGRPDEITLPVDAPGVGPLVRLLTSPVEIWLRNGSRASLGPLALHCGPLSSPDGAVLDGSFVAFDPPLVDVLAPRSSRAIAVSLVGAPPAGLYRGTIQARGAPGVWLPLEVVVEPR